MNVKEEILIKEIITYLPSFSEKTKACLIKMLQRSVCSQHLKDYDNNCVQCVLYNTCRDIQTMYENFNLEEHLEVKED